MIDFSKAKFMSIPEGKVSTIHRKSDDLLLWKSVKNWVRYSTEADGVTIYNGGLGYKSGYRVRSGGAEIAVDNASCTGYIPVMPGDVVRVSGVNNKWGSGYHNAFNAYYDDFTLAGQVAGNNSNYNQFNRSGSWLEYGCESVVQLENGHEWVVPRVASSTGKYCAYIRVTGNTSDGSKLIVTINEEIIV